MPKLLDCPFCGNKASRETYFTQDIWTSDEVEFESIGCEECNINMTWPVYSGNAVQYWNARAPTKAHGGTMAYHKITAERHDIDS